MGFIKRNRIKDFEDEIATEGFKNTKKIRRLDKIYIIIAFILAFAWLVWNITGIRNLKIPYVNLNAIIDRFSDWQAGIGQSGLDANLEFNAFADENYIYYYQMDNTGIYRMKRDGTQNSRIVKDNAVRFMVNNGTIYYVDTSGELKKEVPGENPVVLLSKKLIDNFIVDGKYIYYTTQNTVMTFSSATNNSNTVVLYRMDIDGKNNEKLAEGNPVNFFTYGNYLYYINSSMVKSGIEKVRKSGGKSKEIVSLGDGYAGEMGIYKGWLYYMYGTSLYKCMPDGSKKTKIADEVMYFTVENNTLYITLAENPTGQITNENNIDFEMYSSALDGKNKKILDKENTPVLYLKDGIAISYYGQINRFEDVKTGKTIDLPEVQLNLAADDLKDRIGKLNNVNKIPGIDSDNKQIIKNKNFIYYTEISQKGIFKMNVDNGNTEKVSDEQAHHMDGIGNLLFFTEADNLTGINYLYCMNYDGTGMEKVFDFPVSSYQIEKEGIFFTGNSQNLYEARFDNNRIVKITDDEVFSFQINDGYIYMNEFNGGKNGLYRVKEDGTSKERILDKQINSFDISNGYIFYSDTSNTGIYKCKIGDNTPSLVTDFSSDFTVNGGYLFYRDNTNGRVYRCDYNGKNKVELSGGLYPIYFDSENYYIDNGIDFQKKNMPK